MYVELKFSNPNIEELPQGRLIALDMGTKKVGVAICDEMQITTRPLTSLKRTKFENLLRSVSKIIGDFDAKGLVIGLPLNMNGSESISSKEARTIAQKFSLSLTIPVFLQDERLTSEEAKERLFEEGVHFSKIREMIDSKAAAIILEDFLDLANSLRNKVEKSLTEI